MNVTIGNTALDSPDMPDAEMSALVARLFDKYGRVLLEDRRRLYGLLRDYAPSQLRRTKLLMTAYDQGVPQHFAAHDSAPTSFAVAQAIQSIIAEAGIQTELAQWAIDAWQGALFPPNQALVPQPLVIATAPDALPPVPPAAKLAPPINNAANDLTWGDSEPVISAAIPLAPSAATTAKMTIAPSVQVVLPHASATLTAVGTAQPPAKNFSASKSVFAMVITATIATAGVFYYRTYEENVYQAPSTQEQPAVVPPSTPAPNPSDIMVLSTSSNPKDWPVYANGTIVNATPNTWQFNFNLRQANGRTFGYTASVQLQNDLKSGNAVMAASDFQNYKTDAVSNSPTFTVQRIISGDKNSYITVVNMPSWAKNPARAPLICLSFSSGATARKFEPEHGFFCVDEMTNNACGISLGCGKLK